MVPADKRDGAVDGRRLLSAESVGRLTTNHLTRPQREANVPGRYGRVGGAGTAAHIVPSTGAVHILLTQRAATDPVPPRLMLDFWRYAGAA